MSNETLASLLDRARAAFPESHPVELLPSADAFAPHAERYSGGHAARWFAATNGQVGDEPFADAHALCSLSDALGTARIADDIRAEPDGYWVEPHWLAIASDGAGQHYMIDDHDGRVLSVAHDDDHIEVVAPSPEAWLQQLIDGCANGTYVWDETFGLMNKAHLDSIHASQRAHAERKAAAAQIPPKHRLGLALTIGATLAFMAALIWFLESHR